LGVGGRPEPMSAGFQLAAQLDEVEYFSVVGNPATLVGGGHRLQARVRGIDDRQTHVAEHGVDPGLPGARHALHSPAAQVAEVLETDSIGAAMCYGIAHRERVLGQTGPDPGVPRDTPDDSAHSASCLLSWPALYFDARRGTPEAPSSNGAK